MSTEIINALIKSTMLGTEDPGILTCWVYLNYGGRGQRFGGYVLDEPIRDDAGKFLYREGSSYGMQFIQGILKAVGAESWEKLNGMHCRVECEHTKVHRIGHFLKDQWFDPRELAAKHGLK